MMKVQFFNVVFHFHSFASPTVNNKYNLFFMVGGGILFNYIMVNGKNGIIAAGKSVVFPKFKTSFKVTEFLMNI